MDWFLLFTYSYPHLFYIAAFAAMFIEGDAALLLFGMLSRGHYAAFLSLFAVASAAAILHDFLFWRLGAHLAKYNKKKYLYFDLSKFTGFLNRFKPYAGPIVFLSKFIWNFNRIILISAGYLKIPYKKLFPYSLGASVVWPVTFMSIGYMFADRVQLFKQRIEFVVIAIAIIIFFIVLFELYIRKFISKTFFSDEGGGAHTDDQPPHPNHNIL